MLRLTFFGVAPAKCLTSRRLGNELASCIEGEIEPHNSALSFLMCELRQFRIRCSMSTFLENELAATKAQLALCSLELDQTKAQLDRSKDNIFELEDEINDVKSDCNEAINRKDDAQDRFIEEHNARLAAESNLVIALQALADLRETHAAVLQEVDELSAAVQVTNQFIGPVALVLMQLENWSEWAVSLSRRLRQQPRDM
jgi:chromosome segregation ATPase